MVLRLKAWESRLLPALLRIEFRHKISSGALLPTYDPRLDESMSEAIEDWFEEYQCTTAEEFYDLMRRSHSFWGDGLECFWIFRGHADSNWELLPSVWRPNLNEGFEQNLRYWREEVAGKFDASEVAHLEPHLQQGIDSYRCAVASAIAEQSLIEWFSILSDQIGLSVPSWDKKHHRSLFLELDRWEIGQAYCLAQHYGVPTRLLDWTFDPRIAAFFSCNEESKEAENIAVYALRYIELNTKKLIRPADGSDPSEKLRRLQIKLISSARSTNDYLRAQEGLFTLIHNAHDYFSAEGKWPTLDSILVEHFKADAERFETPMLRKILLPKSERENLKYTLYKDQVTKGHLMPSYENVRETVFWRLSQSGIPI